MGEEELFSGLTQELRRGTLILVVLSQLQGPMYGYQLVKRLNDHAVPMDANTLYPLLRRLEGQGLLVSQWEIEEPKPRKYYQLTPLGRAVLDRARDYWAAFSNNINLLLEGSQ